MEHRLWAIGPELFASWLRIRYFVRLSPPVINQFFTQLEETIYRNWQAFAGVVLLIISTLFYWLYVYDFSTRHVVTIAASDRFDDSYNVAQILANHVNAHSKSIFIEILETQGSKANSRLLLEGKVEFAFVHYDPQLVGTAYSIANMFPDVVQVITRPDLTLNSMNDLKGKKIALATNEDIENEVFDLLIDHYNLEKNSMQLLQTSWKGAYWSLSHGLIDVVFRVKTAANPEVIKLINSSDANFFGVNHSSALNFKYPQFNLAEIPIATFRGSPAVPDHPIQTLGIDRYLVASRNVDNEIVWEMTRVLTEEREYLFLRSALFGFTKMPEASSFIPMHPGASTYFFREKPSFVQRNATLIALSITLTTIIVSVFLNIGKQSKQKRVKEYNRRLLGLRLKIESAKDQLQLKQLREELNGFIGRVVEDAVQGRISTDGFEFFSFTWENVKYMLKDKENELKATGNG